MKFDTITKIWNDINNNKWVSLATGIFVLGVAAKPLINKLLFDMPLNLASPEFSILLAILGVYHFARGIRGIIGC